MDAAFGLFEPASDRLATVIGGVVPDDVDGDDGTYNHFVGGGCNDTLRGYGRNDTLIGDEGNDILVGGDGTTGSLTMTPARALPFAYITVPRPAAMQSAISKTLSAGLATIFWQEVRLAILCPAHRETTGSKVAGAQIL